MATTTTKTFGSKDKKPIGAPIAHLRIGVVKYEHHPIHTSPDGSASIGDMIDKHIADTIHSGSLINEVSMFFETETQQMQLRDFYMATTSPVGRDGVVVHNDRNYAQPAD